MHDPHAPVRKLVDLDPCLREGGAGGPGRDVDDALLETHGVVVPTTRRYFAHRNQSMSAGAGSQSLSGSAASRAKRALKRGTKEERKAFAPSMSETPSSLSSDTSRSWSVPYSRSTRPRAWGESE